MCSRRDGATVNQASGMADTSTTSRRLKKMVETGYLRKEKTYVTEKFP
jgi:DNA-binding Lrp family transcriptional regulator